MTSTHTRRFLAAVIVSLLLHLLVISGTWLRIPERSPPTAPLEAQLVTAKPLPPPEPRAQPVKPRPKREHPRVRRTTPPAPPVPTVAAPSPLALPPPTEAPVAAAAPAESPPTVEKPAPGTPPPSESAIAAPLKSLPAKGRITYTIFLGTDKFSVGRTVQSWAIEGNTYKLASASETTGLASLFAARHLTYLSEGKITTHGLQPDTFLMSRTRRGQLEDARARFDWSAGQITFGKVPAQAEAALPAGSQDIVSFMYQLSLAPPAPGRIRLPITNGVGFETYEFDVSNEEDVETPLGTLKALPVKQVRKPGEESIEVWFAAEYRYLPVKIRFIDREGNPSGEQVVDEIKFSENN